MNRFGTINLLVLSLLLVCSQTSANAKPNVLFISIDDLNDWVGCLHGHPQVKTPNIDRLAKRGVLFTNAHCASPACNPSRAALFSGKMSYHTGIWSNSSPRLIKHRPDLVLLPKVFQKAGYVTLGTGKLMHGGGGANKVLFEKHFNPEQRWSPFTKKQVEYTRRELPSKGTDNPRHTINLPGNKQIVIPFNRMPSDRKPDDNAGESFDWGPVDVRDDEMGDGQIADWAIKHIKKGFDKPFFLGIGFYRPHIPLWAPRAYFDLYSKRMTTLPPIKQDDLADLGKTAKRWAVEPITAGAHATVLKHKQWKAAVAAYLACISFVDHHVGRLLDTLDNSPYANNTLIVLWSDHGWHLGEKQHWGKWTGWERSTRVPLMIVPPKNHAADFAAAGSKSHQPVSLIDLYPTLTDFCGLTPPDDLDGVSLLPLLRKPDRKTSRAVITTFDVGNLTLRTERHRYIRYADGTEELYDNKSDPHEWENLAGDSNQAGLLADFRKHVPKAAISISK